MAYIGQAPTKVPLTSADITDGTIAEADIANDAVNFVTHLKAGTDGELITWDASGNPSAVPVGTDTHVLTSGGTGVAPTFQAASGVATGFIGGLICSNDTDTDHDILISVGSARDYGDAVTMTLGTAITKRIDATWAVGDDAGGLDSTDTVAGDTGYGVYLIRRSDTGVVDVMFSSDMTSAGSALTLPTNYDQKRLIGWVMTDASANILLFQQNGDWFELLEEPTEEFNDGSITNVTYETAVTNAPPNCVCDWLYHMYNASETNQHMWMFLIPTGSSWTSTSTIHAILQVDASSNWDRLGGRVTCATNSASSVDYAVTIGAATTGVQLHISGVRLTSRINP